MVRAGFLRFEAWTLPACIIVDYAVNDPDPPVNGYGLPMPSCAALPGIALASPPLP
jgi:hypothetical protein